jgi:DNA-binding MarR family transcriptional regulator
MAKSAKPRRANENARSCPPGRGQIDLGGIDRCAGYVVRRAQSWMSHEFKRAFGSVNISPAECGVLRLIRANPGLTQTHVADTLGMEKAHLVHMLERLRRRRLISRKRSTDDRRRFELQLTRDGTELLKRVAPMIEAHEQVIIGRIGADGRLQLLKILATFAR